MQFTSDEGQNANDPLWFLLRVTHLKTLFSNFQPSLIWINIKQGQNILMQTDRPMGDEALNLPLYNET